VTIRWKISADQERIKVGGTVISGDMEMAAGGLLEAFHEKRPYMTCSDGSYGLISEEISRLLQSTTAGGAMKGGDITFNRSEFSRIAALFEDVQGVETDPGFDELRYFAHHFDGIKRHAVPDDLAGILRPYQVLGYNWLRTLRHLGFNGILADDMGLGKTLQVLTLIKSLVNEGKLENPVLLIVPKTLLFNWELEIQKFAPELTRYAFTGSGRAKSPDFLKKHHIVLTSYGLLRTEITLFCSMDWDSVILDEATAIKNAGAMTTKAVKHIKSGFRLSITGTPVENSPTDLWSQFDFLMPGFLHSLKTFKDTYSAERKNLSELKDRTRPYILRRLKSQVLSELPPKTDITIFCDFADDQKDVYDRALAEARMEMADLPGNRPFALFQLILRLRQIACHPLLAIKKSRKSYGSGKLDEVFNAAAEILSEGHKILIFSQFTRHLKLVERLFTRHQIPTYYLDGKTPDREAVVQSFKTHDGPCPFFISLKTGGTGLNLSEATYVFLLDPWWNPAVENQAIDRCHRMGQDQPVTVYRFITKGSIEEKVNELKAAKKEIGDAVIDESVPAYMPYDESTLKGLILSMS
jgi:SNF2 family DNA or RNA helicase